MPRAIPYLLQKWSGTQFVKESYKESHGTLLEILGFAPSVNCLKISRRRRLRMPRSTSFLLRKGSGLIFASFARTRIDKK